MVGDSTENDNRQADNSASIEKDVAQTLLAKREDLIRKLQDIENFTAKLKDEYSDKFSELQLQRKPLEEALFHIGALLRLDGHEIDDSGTGNASHGAPIVAISTSVTDAAYDLLKQAHQPMHYQEITKKLQDSNVHIPGKNPSATLLSRISRDRRFKRTKKRGVYALSVWRIKKKASKSKRKRKAR